ncbi:DUF6003 family protein [Streptomyces sp.]|uniref:DUF6003 family protein n=1 Tax=Streptomyces sp. TaxID=1931 RepID=UPI0028112A2C|nr:DUF6003 family protein [Streptomyces sp.]
MTDDAHLFLVDDPAAPPGASATGAGDPARPKAPAVRARLDALGATVVSPGVRLLPPEGTGAVPDGAGDPPVPSGDEELNRPRRAPGQGRPSLPGPQQR